MRSRRPPEGASGTSSAGRRPTLRLSLEPRRKNWVLPIQHIVPIRRAKVGVELSPAFLCKPAAPQQEALDGHTNRKVEKHLNGFGLAKRNKCAPGYLHAKWIQEDYGTPFCPVDLGVLYQSVK